MCLHHHVLLPLQEAPKPPKAKKKTGKNVQEKEEPKTCYTTWDDEIYVASADGIAPGKIARIQRFSLCVYIDVSTPVYFAVKSTNCELRIDCFKNFSMGKRFG